MMDVSLCSITTTTPIVVMACVVSMAKIGDWLLVGLFSVRALLRHDAPRPVAPNWQFVPIVRSFS